jgi:hypothetical protein
MLTPAELALAKGAVLYDWQCEALEAFGNGWPTALLTCNGAGKTAIIAARAVDWFFYAFPQGKLVATSGSFNQLQNQLWPSVRQHLPRSARVTGGTSPLTITTAQGGKGIGFSTNDPGKAEGFHPTIGPDTDPVCILVDECKTVPDEIFEAFDRCTRRFQLYISSSGPPSGRFYNCLTKFASDYYTLRVDWTKCPHIDPRKVERDRRFYGEESPLFRSMHLAEFTSLDGRVVLSPEKLEAAFAIQEAADNNGEKVGFCDFAAGGDENSLAYRWGNVARLHSFWRDTNTTQARREFRQHFNACQLHAGQVWGDADGIGNVIIKDFAEEGFRVREFHGGIPAQDPKNYANLISECWIEACRDIERGRIHLGPRERFDPGLFEQLTTRRLEWDSKGRLRVESKDDMRARGIRSPDRADAFVGAIACGGKMSGALTAKSLAKGSENPFSGGLVTGF